MSSTLHSRDQSQPLAYEPRARSALAAPTVCLVLLVLGGFLHTAAALAQAPQTLPGFAEAIDVRVVNLEVVVTDREGNRVGGLQPEQFQLEVDGEITPIEFFNEIRDGRAVRRQGDEAGGVAEVAALADDEVLRTNYLIFVDDFFSTARDRDRVLDNLRQQLAGLAPRDRVAIVAFDGKAIDLLTSWTSDHAEILAALQRAQRRPAFGTMRTAELRTNDLERRQRQELERSSIERILATGGTVDGDFMETRLDPVELAFANRLTDQVKRSVLASVSTLRSFAGPSGRKVMLLLAGGWPLSTAEFTVNDFRARPEELGAGSLDPKFPAAGKLLQPLADTANLLGYTLYPVDVPGMNRQIGIDASDAGAEFGSLDPAVNAGGAAISREDLVHASLDYLAERTGGRPLINSQRDDALAETIADTRTFYWLGFSPTRREDDQEHEIEITILGRPDLRVRTRSSFIDLSRGAEVTMMVESALLFGDPPSNKPLALQFGKPKKRRGKLQVPLEVGISMDEITLLPQNGRWLGELEIRVTVMDDAGNRSETQLDKIQIDGAYEPRPGQSYFYETTLTLRNREHRIVVAVYDPLSGAILSSSSEIDV